MFKKKNMDKIVKSNAEKRIEMALDIAYQYGGIDGAHHKQWVIDQMIRELCGSDEEYRKWVDIYEAPVGYEDYYEWDTGIAP